MGEGDGLGGIHARPGPDTGGADVLNGTVAVHPHKIEQVNAQIQQGASAQFRTKDPFLIGHVIGQGGGQHNGLADGSRGKDFPRHRTDRHVARPHRLGNEYFFFAGECNDGSRFHGVHHESLLHQAGFSRQNGLPGLGEMAGVRRCNVHQADIRVLQEFRVGAVSPRHAEASGKIPCLLQ